MGKSVQRKMGKSSRASASSRALEVHSGHCSTTRRTERHGTLLVTTQVTIERRVVNLAVDSDDEEYGREQMEIWRPPAHAPLQEAAEREVEEEKEAAAEKEEEEEEDTEETEGSRWTCGICLEEVHHDIAGRVSSCCLRKTCMTCAAALERNSNVLLRRTCPYCRMSETEVHKLTHDLLHGL